MCCPLRASLLTVAVFTLRALALPSGVGRQDAGTIRTIQLDASSVERLKREGNDCPVSEELLAVNGLLTGFRYARDILYSCKTPTLYPDVTAAPEVRSAVFLELVSTVDKVLRLYDFYDTYLTNNCTETTPSGSEEGASSECVEMRALRAVIDTLTNQTCEWVRPSVNIHSLYARIPLHNYYCPTQQIRSLGISYSGSEEEFVCTRSQLQKLHALTSAHILFRKMYNDTRRLIDKFGTNCYDGSNSVPTAEWLRNTGLNTTLHTILAGTDYEASHLNYVLNKIRHPNC